MIQKLEDLSMIKRLLALLLCISLMLPVFAFADDYDDDDDEEELDIGEILDVEFEFDEDGDLIIPDEEGKADDTLSEEMLELLANLEVDDSIDFDNLYINENLPDEDEVLNILLIGVDYRTDPKDKNASQFLPDQWGTGHNHIKRSDVVMILSINAIDGTLKITSISRDLKVWIPDLQTNWEINNAFALRHYKRNSSGQSEFKSSDDRPDILIRTINYNFGLNIKYYVATNFYGVEEIIEYFGGVDVELTKKEAQYVNGYIKKNAKTMQNTYDKHADKRVALDTKSSGVQHLDGLQGLIFARYRSISGETDLARSGRTRRLMQALARTAMAKFKSMPLMELANVAAELSRYFKTNLNIQTLLTTVWPVIRDSEIMSNLDGLTDLIEENRIPRDKGYTYKDGKLYLSNPKQTKTELYEFIYGYDYSDN